jgi:hypothetical protein
VETMFMADGAISKFDDLAEAIYPSTQQNW